MSGGEISGETLTEAIDRIARTPDGRLLYLFCQRRMMALAVPGEPHTLQTFEGERRFAAQLIGLMATGIAESGGRSTSGSSTGGSPEQPIVFTVAKPVRTGGPRGAARRIGPNTRVPGYDPPADP